MRAEHVGIPSWLMGRAQFISESVDGPDFLAKSHTRNRLPAMWAGVGVTHGNQPLQIQQRFRVRKVGHCQQLRELEIDVNGGILIVIDIIHNLNPIPELRSRPDRRGVSAVGVPF
jgi:hypothetical protein